MCVAAFTLDAGLLARSHYSEGPATGHLDTGFSWFPSVYKQTLRCFPRFQVATTCFSCSPPDLNLLVTSFIFVYMENNHCHRVTTQLQFIMLMMILLLLYNMYVSCHRHFFLVLLLNQQWSPPLRLQASHCSTYRIMCDVPSIAVFCSESVECFPGIVSKFFFKLLVTIPVAPIITGTIVHFRFHIRYISVHKLLYFNFFSASFCTTFLSAGIATSISVRVFSFLFLIIISGLFAVTSLCVLIIIIIIIINGFRCLVCENEMRKRGHFIDLTKRSPDKGHMFALIPQGKIVLVYLHASWTSSVGAAKYCPFF